MLHSISPNHFHFYEFLRSRWLNILDLANELPELSEEIKSLTASIGKKIPLKASAPFQTALPLEQYIDDTPVTDFLTRLETELDQLEQLVFKRLITLSGDVISDLLVRSALNGRLLAQDLKMSLFLQDSDLNIDSLYTAAELALAGGVWPQLRFLLRRKTKVDLSYELLSCPHKRTFGMQSKQIADLACRIESAFARGFYEALMPQAKYSRKSADNYCADFVSNHL